MATTAELELHYFDEGTAIDLLNDPFFVADEGVDIAQPQRSTDNTSPSYGTVFGEGIKYGPRTVDITLGIKTYNHANVSLLYKYIDRLNLISRFVTQPLMVLKVRFFDTGAGEDSTGYLKVIDAEIRPSNSLFSIASVYDQESIGQVVNLSLTCEPFFYEHNFLTNTWEDVTITYPNVAGAGFSSGTTATFSYDSPDMHRSFYIAGNNIKGDAPAPVVLNIDNTSALGGYKLKDVFIGANYAIDYLNYPDSINTTMDSDSVWATAQDFTFTDGESFNYKLAGKVFAVLFPDKSYTDVSVEIQIVDSVSNVAVDSTKLYFETLSDPVPIGTMVIPMSGRQKSDYYQLNIIITGDTGSLQVVFIPAWNMKGFIATGSGTEGELVYNPYENVLLGRNASSGFSTHVAIGDGLYVIPDVSLRAGIVWSYDVYANMPENDEVQLQMRYNPRYLFLRDLGL